MKSLIGHLVKTPSGCWVHPSKDRMFGEKLTRLDAYRFAPPVESRVLGSVTTPSGASPLAGHPDCVPLTMSGDAWEAAANHVIATRKKPSPNRNTWQQIGLFLDAQHLETLGLRRVAKGQS